MFSDSFIPKKSISCFLPSEWSVGSHIGRKIFCTLSLLDTTTSVWKKKNHLSFHMMVFMMARIRMYYLQNWSKVTALHSLLTWLFGTLKTIPEAQKWGSQTSPLLFFLLKKVLWVGFFHYWIPSLTTTEPRNCQAEILQAKPSHTFLLFNGSFGS